MAKPEKAQAEARLVRMAMQDVADGRTMTVEEAFRRLHLARKVHTAPKGAH